MSSYQSNVLEHFKQSLLANTCSKFYLRKLWKLAVPFVDLSSCFPIRLTLIEVAPTFFFSSFTPNPGCDDIALFIFSEFILLLKRNNPE